MTEPEDMGVRIGRLADALTKEQLAELLAIQWFALPFSGKRIRSAIRRAQGDAGMSEIDIPTRDLTFLAMKSLVDLLATNYQGSSEFDRGGQDATRRMLESIDALLNLETTTKPEGAAPA